MSGAAGHAAPKRGVVAGGDVGGPVDPVPVSFEDWILLRLRALAVEAVLTLGGRGRLPLGETDVADFPPDDRVVEAGGGVEDQPMH